MQSLFPKRLILRSRSSSFYLQSGVVAFALNAKYEEHTADPDELPTDANRRTRAWIVALSAINLTENMEDANRVFSDIWRIS